MSGIVKLTVPKERFSAIDYFLEKLDELGEVTGIKITVSSYERTKQDPYIHQDTREKGKCEKWVGEETTIGDRYYPPLIYFLIKLNNGDALVTRIEYGEKVFEFEETYNVVIDY